MSSYKFPSSRVSGPALKETILCGVLQLLAFLAVWLRLWARRMKRKRLEFNDYVILVAWFFCASLLGTAIACECCQNVSYTLRYRLIVPHSPSYRMVR